MKEKKKNRKKQNEIDLLLEHTTDIKILDEESVYKPKQFKKKKKSEKSKRKKVRNTEIAAVTYFFVVLFLVMMAYIGYFTTVRSKAIINSPYNVRLDSMSERVVRGQIQDCNGNVLAETEVMDDGSEVRKYPYGDVFAHVVGYDVLGKSGLESIGNFELLTSNANFFERLIKEFQEKKNIGDNVISTLDADLQQAAYDALGNYKGAVVVMEASTGKVLALVSKPAYNPNTILDNWEWLKEDENSTLLNRATQGAYAPGSVFKLVTTLAYMRDSEAFVDYAYECTGAIVENGTTIHCANNRIHGMEDLAISLANSCNASYSNIGLQLKYSTFQKTAKDLLFDSQLPTIMPYTQSKFRLTKDSHSSEVMMTAIGQGKTQMSPYHVALITSAIANGGTLMKPYLIDRVENHVGKIVEKNLPEKYAKLMTSAEASQLKTYMSGVVEYGTAGALRSENYTVAGKTGTAEYSNDKEKSHSWFTGFSNVENPELVITVVVESADNSGMSAVTVAKKVLNAYY